MVCSWKNTSLWGPIFWSCTPLSEKIFSLISNQLPDFVICLSHSMICCCWLASLGSYISTDTDMSFAALLAFLMCSNMSSKWFLYGPSNAASCHAACSACGPPLYSIHSCRLQCSCSSHPLIPQDCRFPHWMAHLYNSLINYLHMLPGCHTCSMYWTWVPNPDDWDWWVWIDQSLDEQLLMMSIKIKPQAQSCCIHGLIDLMFDLSDGSPWIIPLIVGITWVHQCC